MRNDQRMFLRRCFIIAGIAFGAVIVMLWVMDTVFNGVVLNLFTLISENLSRRFHTRSLLLGIVLTLSAITALVGVLCAYRTYTGQHAQLLEARAEGERAKALFETEVQRKSDLITYLAHDLKTPLASVIAYLSLLDENPEFTLAQRAKYVGIALDKAYRLEQLIGELFEIIRFNLQTITVNAERIPLKLMLEQLADEFYPILLPQGKRISVTCDEGLVLRGDADKLARVFNNILKNAAAYSEENTEIAVHARQDAKGTQIRFVNHGNPIPKQKQEVIFEKFYRLDASRATKTGGAGLGLAIAKEIVEAHGGSIAVRSDESETVFTVILP